jgi:predicted lipid-binding transport protein (Tim44 family)
MNNVVKYLCLTFVALVLVFWVFERYADARAGGGRSMGSRGSRSVSPSRSTQSSPTRQQAAPIQQPGAQPMQQPAGGGFFRNMAGGVLGGMLGGMLLGSLFGMKGGLGGGGFGLIEILLLAGGGFLLYRMFIKKKAQTNPASSYYQQGYSQPQAESEYQSPQPIQPAVNDIATGISNIRQMDSSFNEDRFTDMAMDFFFKIQGAWMNRDITPVKNLLTDEMAANLQKDIAEMLRDGRVNRLENIAVRTVDIDEAWQESGQDFISVRIYANLLDYTTDDKTGGVITGSKTEPVKFEEHWTFTRNVGNNPWRLAAIEQQ